MKKLLIVVVILAVCFVGCGSTGSSSTAASAVNLTSFADATGKEWKLVEVYVENSPFSKKVIYDRNDLRKEKIEKTYTLNFTLEMISGTGAPNTYSAPYTRGEGKAIEVQLIRSTMMAPITQPEKLQEFVYFGYLQKAYEWGLEGGKLVITSKSDTEAPVKLVFAL